MIARYASAVTAGTLITLALLYSMQSLIHLQPMATAAPRERAEVTWVMQRPEPTPPSVIEHVIDPEVLKNVPVDPAPPKHGYSGAGLRVHSGTHRPGPVTSGPTGIATPDGPLISMMLVQPTYPAAAEARGLEGWVDVRFDVLADGRVVNVEISASSHRIFENAAIRAAERFRFRAPVVNGVPQTASDIEYRFRFDMPD
ncbi:MAG: TonB family protein [Woeseiaceae bacterium]|nr:TonB family protein [Woeseiaceae bacterium]